MRQLYVKLNYLEGAIVSDDWSLIDNNSIIVFGNINKSTLLVGATYNATDISTGFTLSSYPILDIDAQSFITAAGITNSTQKSAINELVISSKNNGWWILCNAIYPFVGGNSFSHKFNLKNTSLYGLSFSSGWIHSATGSLPNGTSAYANNNLQSSVVQTLNDTHISMYAITPGSNGVQSDIYGGPAGNNIYQISFSDGAAPNHWTTYCYNDSTSLLLVVGTSSRTGFLLSSRISSTNLQLYKDGISVGTYTASGGGLPTDINGFYFGSGVSFGSPNGFSNRTFGFATIGSGINSSIASLMYNDIQRFQYSLSRQV